PALLAFPTRRSSDLELGVEVALADVHAKGGAGGLELADIVIDTLKSDTADFRPLYALEQPLAAKIETIAREIYGADGVDYVGTAARDIARLEEIGMRDVPVCMAKTQYSFSDNPALRGRPK